MADISTYTGGGLSTTETRNPYGPQYSGLPGVSTGNLGELLKIVVAAKRAKENRERADAMRMMQASRPAPEREGTPGGRWEGGTHQAEMERIQEKMANLKLQEAQRLNWDPLANEPDFIKDPYGGQVPNKNKLDPYRKDLLTWLESGRMMGGAWSPR